MINATSWQCQFFSVWFFFLFFLLVCWFFSPVFHKYGKIGFETISSAGHLAAACWFLPPAHWHPWVRVSHHWGGWACCRNHLLHNSLGSPPWLAAIWRKAARLSESPEWARCWQDSGNVCWLPRLPPPVDNSQSWLANVPSCAPASWSDPSHCTLCRHLAREAAGAGRRCSFQRGERRCSCPPTPPRFGSLYQTLKSSSSSRWCQQAVDLPPGPAAAAAVAAAEVTGTPPQGWTGYFYNRRRERAVGASSTGQSAPEPGTPPCTASSLQQRKEESEHPPPIANTA